MLSISTFAIITVVISFVNQRWRRLLPITHGVPIIVLRDGQPDLKALTAERLSLHDLFAAAREEEIRRLSDVELAVLEADGKISFFSHDDGASGAPEPAQTG